MMANSSYLIVGAGVFGASTALHLVRKYPNAHIRLVDRNAFTAPTRVAASWDWNKVIRADYLDIVYTRLALEARELWKKDPLWRDYFHESGIYWISQTGFAEQARKNFEELGVDADIRSYTVAEAKELYGGAFADADYTGVSKILVNGISGWADAGDALQRVIQEAVDLGAEYVEAEVTALDLEPGEDGGCKGVVTKDGRTLTADKIILCTGAYTAKLLMDSAPDRPSLQAADRIVAAAVGEAIAPLDDRRLQSLLKMPVAIQENPIERGARSGCLPPNKNGVLKLWGQWIFSNTTDHPRTGAKLSVPPSGTDYDQWNVPDSLRDDVRFANKAILGKLGEGVELDEFRICWEALTPSQDFIVSPHTSCAHLYIATCGSFHGFKFFPVIGKYVVQMLDEELEEELKNKWAWDRQLPSPDHCVMWPRKELRDL